MKNESDIREYIKYLAESVNAMKLSDSKREIVKAGLRFAIEYANEKYANATKGN